MIALIIFIILLFFLGIGNAVITYHILRYRDPDDIAGIVLGVYYVMVTLILVSTAVLVNWSDLFA